MAAIAAFVAIFVAAGLYLWYPRGAPGGAPPLTVVDAKGVAEFAAVFDSAADSIRVVAFLSPT